MSKKTAIEEMKKKLDELVANGGDENVILMFDGGEGDDEGLRVLSYSSSYGEAQAAMALISKLDEHERKATMMALLHEEATKFGILDKKDVDVDFKLEDGEGFTVH